jgi:hypothetical protein
MSDAANLAQSTPPKFTSIDEAVQHYVDMRDHLTEKRREFEAFEANIKLDLEKTSMWLRDKADELGVDSFKTQFGTAYRATKVSYRVGDWDLYVKWLIETGNYAHCVEKRCAKLAVQEIHNDTGVLPPGLLHNVEVEMDVRRPTKQRST